MDANTEERLFGEIREQVMADLGSGAFTSDNEAAEAIDRAIKDRAYGLKLTLTERLRLKKRIFDSAISVGQLLSCTCTEKHGTERFS